MSALTAEVYRLEDRTGLGLEQWAGWLRCAIDSGWRAGEWDAQLWLFKGDLDDPRTAAYRCETTNCVGVVPARTRCDPCRKILRSGEMTPEQLDALPVVRAVRYGIVKGCIS